MKRSLLVLVLAAGLAAIPVAGQPGFQHGHKLGTSVAPLTEPGDVRDGNPIGVVLSNGAGQGLPGQIVIQFSGGQFSGGSGTPAPQGPKPSAVFETWAEQTSSDYMESVQVGVTVLERAGGKAVFQRFVRDNLRLVYASYTVTVETLPQEGTYRLSFGPPSDGNSAPALGADWKVLVPAKFPVPQILKEEDSVRLEMYASSATRRVVDYIHAGRQDRMTMRKETPRDYYAEDAEFAFTQPSFRVNGVAIPAAAAMPETTRGPVLWVYVPGHGRYVLSLRPHSQLGFEEAGEASGNSLTFTADGNVFRIDTAARIAAGSGTYTVHLLRDQAWEPADPRDRERIQIGASLGVIGSGLVGAAGAAGPEGR